MPDSGPEAHPIAVVTGANGGIGSAVTAALSSRGYRVLPWTHPPYDVTNSAGVADAISEIEHDHGPISALVHTAGALLPDAALSPDSTALERCMEVNFCGTVNVCSAIAQRMVVRRHGAIVVVSSNAATVPRANLAAYCASKAATTAWTKVLGLECAPFGVRCNVVSPGSTDTPMLTALTGSAPGASIVGRPEEFRLGIPLGRIATPQDIAHTCAFLLSDAAAHITMHDLRVDGGATLDA